VLKGRKELLKMSKLMGKNEGIFKNGLKNMFSGSLIKRSFSILTYYFFKGIIITRK
jgi:hypothetical protein